jgi:hypothetical protein
MMLDGAEECQLSGPIGELVPFTLFVGARLRQRHLPILPPADCSVRTGHDRVRN